MGLLRSRAVTRAEDFVSRMTAVFDHPFYLVKCFSLAAYSPPRDKKCSRLFFGVLDSGCRFLLEQVGVLGSVKGLSEQLKDELASRDDPTTCLLLFP